jgi:uncharacterized surface protein with fasciclin (FAS1) repeats
MKTRLKSGLLATSLVFIPLAADAGMCGSGGKNYGPGKNYMKQGYKPHPHSYRYSHPMPRHHGYGRHAYSHPGHPHHGYKAMKPYPYGNTGQGEGAAQKASPDAAYGAAAEAAQAATTSNIIETAASAGNFNTLLDAIRTAGLEETLKGDGPFTVFAPSDEAFARVPEKILAAVVADPEALKELLTYHVVAGRFDSSDVAGLSSATSVQGSELSIDTSNGVNVGGANVVSADIVASNGIIHVVDSVMMPN